MLENAAAKPPLGFTSAHCHHITISPCHRVINATQSLHMHISQKMMQQSPFEMHRLSQGVHFNFLNARRPLKLACNCIFRFLSQLFR